MCCLCFQGCTQQEQEDLTQHALVCVVSNIVQHFNPCGGMIFNGNGHSIGWSAWVCRTCLVLHCSTGEDIQNQCNKLTGKTTIVMIFLKWKEARLHP